jgi:glycosyltransferase involved in cell wall biosynthesis
MRIGINLLYLKPGIVGGTETYATQLLKEFSYRYPDEEFILFINRVTKKKGIFDRFGFKEVICEIDGTNTSYRHIYEQMILPRKVKEAKCHILHSLGYVGPINLSCPHVVTIHDANFAVSFNKMPRGKRICLRFFVDRSAKKATKIVTVSQFSANQIQQHLAINNNKIVVIYNGGADGEIIQRPFPGTPKQYILAGATSLPHKNLETVIRAFKAIVERLPNMRLILFGPETPYQHTLRELANNLNIEGSIIFTGFINKEQLNYLYANAAVFVFPSLYEGFGIPVIEAMKNGTPVICSKEASLGEIAGDAAILLNNPLDVGELTFKIVELLNNDKLRKDLIEKGYKRQQFFTWRETAKRTYEVYKEVLRV